MTPTLAEASFGTGLTATLPVAGSYWLVLQGSESSASSISYSFAISGTAPASVVVQGLDAPQSGTLDAGASVTFTFAIPAGLIYDFNSLDRSFGPVTATLSDPNNKQVFSANASSDEGPFVAVVPGTYTLVLSNGGLFGIGALQLRHALAARFDDRPDPGRGDQGTLTLGQRPPFSASPRQPGSACSSTASSPRARRSSSCWPTPPATR